MLLLKKEELQLLSLLGFEIREKFELPETDISKRVNIKEIVDRIRKKYGVD